MITRELPGTQDLATDMVDPGAVAQAWVVVAGQQRQVLGARQFAGDHGSTDEGSMLALQPPGHHFGGGDAPLGELLEVLPLGLDPRARQVAVVDLAGAAVALDVVAHAVALHAEHLGQRVVGQLLAFEGEHRVEAAEIGGEVLVVGFESPTRHQSRPP
ncbi:hypothetical protein D3C80_1332100 [compost metagenome]